MVYNDCLHLVSIIMPAYNAEKYISEAIESILNQTYQNFELIIIDDGSTDDTQKICKAYEALDNRVRVFIQKNQGAQIARKKGISESKGEYIGFIDADDIAHKELYSRLVYALETTNSDMATCLFTTDFGEFKNSSDCTDVSIREIVGSGNISDVILGKNHEISAAS